LRLVDPLKREAQFSSQGPEGEVTQKKPSPPDPEAVTLKGTLNSNPVVGAIVRFPVAYSATIPGPFPSQ